MKKTIGVIFLLIIISLSFGYVIIKLETHGEEDNYTNTHWRKRLARYPLLRNIFDLHLDGDARTDYLGQDKKEILVEIDSMRGLEFSEETYGELTKSLENITGKKIKIVYSDLSIPYSPRLSSEQIEKLYKKYHDFHPNKNTSVLYVLIASQKENFPELIGSTWKEDGIVIFFDNINNISNFGFYSASNFSLGTILHEVGHQLGLPHNSQPNCLMNPQVESSKYIISDEILTEYCDYERDLIKRDLQGK